MKSWSLTKSAIALIDQRKIASHRLAWSSIRKGGGNGHQEIVAVCKTKDTESTDLFAQMGISGKDQNER